MAQWNVSRASNLITRDCLLLEERANGIDVIPSFSLEGFTRYLTLPAALHAEVIPSGSWVALLELSQLSLELPNSHSGFQ